ncbi:MAG: ATP-binding protein [Gammaproteobacteria bacterium]
MPPAVEPARDPLAPENLDREVHAQMITLLYRQQKSSMAANAFVSVLFVYLLWDTVSHLALTVWLIAHWVIIGIRIASRMRFDRRPRTHYNERLWGRRSAAITLLFGVSWGLCALLFIDADNPTSIIVLTIIITGFAGGSITAFAPYFPAFIAHVYPSMGGLVIALASIGETLPLGLAALVSIALVAYTSMSRNVNRKLEQSERLAIENNALGARAEARSQLLRTILETMSQGILVSDSLDRPVLWNDRLATLLGADVTAGSLDAPGTGERRIAELLAAADLPDPSQLSDQSEHQMRDGKTLELARGTMPGGGIVTTFTNITPQIGRERAIQAARESAEHANAAKSRFLASASHDLRQPIHAMGLWMDTLATSQINTQNPGKTPEVVERIRESLDAVSSMLDSLLDISKLEAGVVHPHPETFDLVALVEELHRSLSVQAREKNLRLRLRAPPSPCRVHSDRAMVGRVLRNLLTNALRYTNEGGVLLALRANDAVARIDVIDTGIGIPADEQERVFLEFHQVGNPQRNRQQGLGLGLAIVKRLIDLLGAELTLRSRPGRGSRFSLCLPLGDCTGPHATENRHAEATGDLSGRRILVLDDDPDVLEATGVILDLWNCDVQLAADIEEALDTVRQWHPELLIVDNRLPDGWSASRAIEALRATIGAATPALVVTGDTGPEQLREVRASGHALLNKPVKTQRLHTLIGALLNDGGRSLDELTD